MTQTFRTHSPEETQEIGVRIGQQLNPGDVVALIGDLGVGKTCLTQGIARGAGIYKDQIVNSPSYILINEYEGKMPIYHIDLYRLQHLEEIIELGLEEYLEGDGICVIEWADRMGKLLPQNCIQVRITGADEFTRTIEVDAVGAKMVEGEYAVNCVVTNLVVYRTDKFVTTNPSICV